MAGAKKGVTRREFVAASGGLAAAGLAASLAMGRVGVHNGAGRVRVGVIGCGGRGTGAAVNALEASADTEIVALADVFEDRLASARRGLASIDGALAERVKVSAERCHAGFDAYERLLSGDVDMVILATPPHFRPAHFEAAVAAGKHVFMEKPVAVDPVGVRRVLAAGERAREKGLAVVAGTQRRHETCYLEAMARLRDGAVGKIVAARCYWNQGGLWMHERKGEWSDMEWQLRNWLYFTWLSGDHICEQHVHNLDVINWAMGSPPARAMGMGGRQSRVSPAYGHVFDHFAVEYEYPGGVVMTSMCRQADGCAGRVEECVVGTEGMWRTGSGSARIEGASGWRFSGTNNNPYVQEHVDLVRSIVEGTPLNETRAVAEATLTAIMGRMSAYTGKEVTWERAMSSQLDLTPAAYEMGALPVGEVAVPGRTPLV